MINPEDYRVTSGPPTHPPFAAVLIGDQSHLYGTERVCLPDEVLLFLVSNSPGLVGRQNCGLCCLIHGDSIDYNMPHLLYRETVCHSLLRCGLSVAVAILLNTLVKFIEVVHTRHVLDYLKHVTLPNRL